MKLTLLKLTKFNKSNFWIEFKEQMKQLYMSEG